MKRYIVGYIREGKQPNVRLQEVDEHGKYIGDPMDAAGFNVHGVITTSEYGQVVLQDDNDTLEPMSKSTKTSKPKE